MLVYDDGKSVRQLLAPLILPLPAHNPFFACNMQFDRGCVAACATRLRPVQPSPPRPVLVVDFGAQYAQLIARRVREARVYSEVIPHTATVEEIKAKDPQAIVLSGGPASVYADGAPQLDPALFDLGLPVFGICYGFQAMAQALGGTVAHTGTSEYGRTELKVVGGQLHSDLPDYPAGVDEPR